MRSITCAGLDVASKGKLMSTLRRLPASVAKRISSTLRSLKPSRSSFLQKRCTLATETLARAANSLIESPRMSSPMARAAMPSCCSVGVRPCASVILRLISMRTPTLAKPAKKGQVYFGRFCPQRVTGPRMPLGATGSVRAKMSGIAWSSVLMMSIVSSCAPAESAPAAKR